MSELSEYVKFKTELAKLCEYGKIGAATKRKFSHYDYTSPGKLIYSACSDIILLSESDGISPDEFAAVADAVIRLCGEAVKALGGFERDVATVCAYITLAAESKRSAAPLPILKKMLAHREDCEKSLQNLKYELPLF